MRRERASEALTTLNDAVGPHFPSCFLSTPYDQPTPESPPWPSIIFLHGIGERGDDVERVKKHGLPKFCTMRESAPFRSGFPFCVVAPQCPEESLWCDPPILQRLETLVAQLATSPLIDERRLYLSGWSLGGCATWSLALRRPKQFAAIAAISSRCFEHDDDPRQVRARLRDLPIWIAYGLHDRQVAPEHSTGLIRTLGDRQDLRVRVFTDKNTKYEAEAHVSACERTYADPELYRWFLAHVKGTA